MRYSSSCSMELWMLKNVTGNQWGGYRRLKRVGVWDFCVPKLSL